MQVYFKVRHCFLLCYFFVTEKSVYCDHLQFRAPVVALGGRWYVWHSGVAPPSLGFPALAGVVGLGIEAVAHRPCLVKATPTHPVNAVQLLPSVYSSDVALHACTVCTWDKWQYLCSASLGHCMITETSNVFSNCRCI